MRTNAGVKESPSFGIRVAIIEDDPDQLECLEEFVRFQGHRVEGFANAQSLLIHDHLDKFDLFIIDIRMPVIDGVTLARTLKYREESAGKSLIAVTGDGDVLRSGSTRAEFDECLLKPVLLEDLGNAISSALAKRG
jgi:DNA-binding NtrC family response regulator